jgi:hypothetical protein
VHPRTLALGTLQCCLTLLFWLVRMGSSRVRDCAFTILATETVRRVAPNTPICSFFSPYFDYDQLSLGRVLCERPRLARLPSLVPFPSYTILGPPSGLLGNLRRSNALQVHYKRVQEIVFCFFSPSVINLGVAHLTCLPLFACRTQSSNDMDLVRNMRTLCHQNNGLARRKSRMNFPL